MIGIRISGWCFYSRSRKVLWRGWGHNTSWKSTQAKFALVHQVHHINTFAPIPSSLVMHSTQELSGTEEIYHWILSRRQQWRPLSQPSLKHVTKCAPRSCPTNVWCQKALCCTSWESASESVNRWPRDDRRRHLPRWGLCQSPMGIGSCYNVLDPNLFIYSQFAVSSVFIFGW